MKSPRKKIIVSVTNDLATDQRVHKVCDFLCDSGFDVLLVGRKLPNSLPLSNRNYRTKRMRLLFRKGVAFYVAYNFRLFFLLLFQRCTHLLSNDLDTLGANYFASILKRNCTLVYDSHEYFTEVPELAKHPFKKKIWETLEGFIFPKLQKIYTVNESIAAKYTAKYHKKVEVVRNASPRWRDENIPSKKMLGIPENKKLLIAQGAGINVDRGVEEAVLAMKYTEGLFLMIVGDGDVLQQLKAMVKQENLEDKVGFYGKRPYQEMMYYTYYADMGLTLDKDTNLNYRFSLPNKVFDYIQASTPILASDLIEVKKIVLENNIGCLITSHQAVELAGDFMRCLTDEATLNTWKGNCQITAANFSWENELSVLKRVYDV